MTEKPQRKIIRLQDYDYSRDGAYYITICVKGRHELLGEIPSNVGAGFSRPQMILSDFGKIVEAWIPKITEKYPYVTVKNHIVMPHHIHMFLWLNDTEEGRDDPAPTDKRATIGQIIGYFKYQTTKEINIPGFWQRSYHDRIIRGEDDYREIWQYIDENPLRWDVGLV